jgi:N-methylhydantoinase A
MGYRIAIDTGGTFTDLVLADEQGNMYLGKAPTTFERIFSGSSEVLAGRGRSSSVYGVAHRRS